MNGRLRINDADLRGSWLLVSVGTILVVASVAVTAVHGLIQPRTALAFGGFIAFGEFVRITLPGQREAAPLSAAGALAYALLGDVGGTMSTHDVGQVVAVTASGMLVGLLPHAAVGRAPRLDYVARRVLAVAFAAALFRPAYASESLDLFGHPALFALFLALVVAATGLIDAVLGTMARAGRDGAPFLAALRDELRVLFGISSAIGATGMLIALAADIMKLWAIPVFCIPLLVTQFSFRRFAEIRETYLQTIRSLSRLTELGGYTETEHARRVTQLSLAVGRELGMSERDLLELEYAALMHDIGQLSLTDPIPGGATVVSSPSDQRRIAELGAQVIRQTGVLDNVATIVELQAEPYRRPHQPVDGSVPLSSRIIKAANAYDDLAGGSLDPTSRLDALERLRLGMAYEYDPRVVESLSRVVGRTSYVA